LSNSWRQNKEEPRLYFKDLSKCDYLVDLKTETASELEPDYLERYPDLFEELTSFDYLDSQNSHRFFRAFYVPFYSYKFCKYSKYVLLRNKVLENS
jgi:alpha-1,2-mannosyltransferase